MPVGMAMIIVEMAKKMLPTEVMPTVNMWCAQTPRLINAIDDGRRHHDRVAEDRLARKDRDDFRGDREGRKHQNINLRMPEDPEEVRPEHRRAARLRVKKIRVEISIQDQHDLAGRERRHRDDDEKRGHEKHPDQERHLAKGHALASQAENRHENIDRGRDAADAVQQERKRPVVRAVSLGKRFRGQWRIGKPADVRGRARVIKAGSRKVAREQEKSAEQEDPESERIESRKGHVARADHQGNEIVRKSEDPRHGHEKNHRRAVHREEAIEDVRLDELAAWEKELHADQRGHDARDDEKQKPRANIHQPELLVVHRVDQFLHDPR